MSGTPIWQEPVRGFYTDPGQFVALSGLDYLRSLLDGDGLPPPIGYLCGLRIAAVESGGATFTLPVTDWLLPPQGVVSGATLALLVDAPLGCTVQTALPPATPFTSAEISLSFLRTLVPRSGTLTAKGRLIHCGKTIAVSEVDVTDGAGRLIAVASSRLAILPRVGAPWEMVGHALKNPARVIEPKWPTPHPFERPVIGEVIPQEVWARTSGVDVLRGIFRFDLPAAPLHQMLGIGPLVVVDG